MNSTAFNVTEPNFPPPGNAYCSASVETISVCCKNSTNFRGYDNTNYCILNQPTGIRDCLKAISDKFNGDGGTACTGNITEVQREEREAQHQDDSSAGLRGQRGSLSEKKLKILLGLGAMFVVGLSAQI